MVLQKRRSTIFRRFEVLQIRWTRLRVNDLDKCASLERELLPAGGIYRGGMKMQTQTKIPAGSLQVQKGRFHMVIHVEREGKMTPVWRTTGLPAEERFRAQAETMLPGDPAPACL